MHLNGENLIVNMSLEGKKLEGNGRKICDSEKRTPGAGLSPPWDNIHVYY